MSPPLIVPSPPAFLDPLTQLDTCFYYAVPKFFGQNHPNTRWLVTMLKNCEEDRLKHKMEISPGAFKGVYYQMMDNPQLYIPEDVAAVPMFKRRAVVYLSPLGMALYLGNASIVELFIQYKDTYGEPMCDISEPQYATHLQDSSVGDFHAFPLYLVMMRRCCFGCAEALLKAGWDPSQPVAMPMRRKFERRVFYFRDWLDVALGILVARPMYQLQVLVREMTQGSGYRPVRMLLERLLPPDPKAAEPIGLIEVDQLPEGIAMTGVRSLLDMAEHYDRYLQMRQCATQVASLKREAAAVGINPEVLMIQALDYDGGDGVQVDQSENSNAYRPLVGRCGIGFNNSSSSAAAADTDNNDNNAVADVAPGQPPQARHVMLNVNMSASKKKEPVDQPYASEGCRILQYALMRDTGGKSMQICMEAFCVLLRRGYYMQPIRPDPTSSLARDVRNTVCLLLNLIQREQTKVDIIVDKIRCGIKRFPHLEEHKKLENRKVACVQYISKLVGILTKLLLHSKLIVTFVQADFPPFSPSTINFQLNPHLEHKFKELKCDVIREFNSCKEAWTYLDKEMLKTISGIAAMQLRFKVGKTPTMPPKKPEKNKNKSNMSNTNSCFVSYRRIQRRPKASAEPTLSVAESAAAVTDSVSVSASASASAWSATADANDSEAALPMDSSSSAGVQNFDEDNCNLPDHRTSAADDSMAAVSGAATVASTVAATSSDMEQLLANLCREVDSLFRPLESVEPAGTTPAVEQSTIEPDLAPTPMPTQTPTLTPTSTPMPERVAGQTLSVAAGPAVDKGAPVQRQPRRRRRPQQSALMAKKPKQLFGGTFSGSVGSGVRRPLNNSSATERQAVRANVAASLASTAVGVN